MSHTPSKKPSFGGLATGTMIPASRCATEAARTKFLDKHLAGLPAKIRRYVTAGVVNDHLVQCYRYKELL